MLEKVVVVVVAVICDAARQAKRANVVRFSRVNRRSQARAGPEPSGAIWPFQRLREGQHVWCQHWCGDDHASCICQVHSDKIEASTLPSLIVPHTSTCANSATRTNPSMEWLEMDARLEQRKHAKLRRQQRELRREQKEREAFERQQQLLARRCDEMRREELLSVEMERMHAQEVARRQLELQREEDMRVFRETGKTRRHAQTLGVPVSTPGLSGPLRLHELQIRIEEKEAVLKRAAAAKERLDALPARRSALKQLITRFRTTSLEKKVERAVFELRCERFASLFGPESHAPHNRTEQLLNHESANGFTPALAAIFCRKLSVLRRVLELGASPDFETSWGMTPLLASVMTDDVVAASILMEFEVNVDRETKHCVRALHLAADKGRSEILKALLRGGASVNASNGDGRTPLMQAVASNQLEAAKGLLAFDADKNAKDPSGQTALQWANKLGFAHIASLLGSSVSSSSLHTQLFEEEEEENQGIAVSASSAARLASTRRARLLETAMRDRDLARVRQLLEDSSFSPNYEDPRGDTPFLVACEFGSCADILFCLDKKAIPTHQNRHGRNGLMAACYRGDIATLQLLIKAGVGLQTRDFSGWDAFRHLSHHEHPDVVEQLMKTHCTSVPTSPFVLGDPLSTKALLRSSESATSVHLPTTNSARSDPETSYNIDFESSDITVLTARDSVGDGGDRDKSSTSDEADGDDSTIDPALHKWRIRQVVLKKDRGRRVAFDLERERILRAAKRGRRHGLVAPLPGDPAGRMKFPTCDNCKACRARKRCAQCDQVLCDKCHARLHELAQRRHHQFEELEPEVYVGQELRDAVVVRQANSLKYLVDTSTDLVASMRAALLGDADNGNLCSLASSPKQHAQDDPEVERFKRAKRLAREKRIMQMQINVPVASAKHATREGEGGVFANPAEIELANLYIVQKKYEKAKELLEQTRTLVSESLGELHPTMLKISIGLAKIQKVSRTQSAVS